MDANVARALGDRRRIVGALILAVSLIALLPYGLSAAEPSTTPSTVESPDTTLSPAQALCDSVDDLGLIIGFLRETDVSQDGWLPIFVGAVAALSEARQLAGSAGETYRPLIEDMVASMEGLRSTVDELDERETIGARIAVIGEAITDVGTAMDALSVQLREPCPSATPVATETPPG